MSGLSILHDNPANYSVLLDWRQLPAIIPVVPFNNELPTFGNCCHSLYILLAVAVKNNNVSGLWPREQVSPLENDNPITLLKAGLHAVAFDNMNAKRKKRKNHFGRSRSYFFVAANICAMSATASFSCWAR